MRSYFSTPEGNVFHYYKKSLLGNLVKLLEAMDDIIIDNDKWASLDKFTQQLKWYDDHVDSKFLHDMTDFTNSPHATHPVFAELYLNFNQTLKFLLIEYINERVEKIDGTIEEELKKYLDPDNTHKNLAESTSFIGDASTCKNFLELELKNVIIDDKLIDFVHSNSNAIYATLLQKQTLTTYRTCLQLNQTDIDAEIENVDNLINSSSNDFNHKKFLIKKVALENVRDEFLKLLPDALNSLLPIISRMRHFEAILFHFKAEHRLVEKIGQLYEKLSDKFLNLDVIVEVQRLKKDNGILDLNQLDNLGYDLIITALINSLVDIDDLSHRGKFNGRMLSLPHKNDKIYKNLDIDRLAEKLKKILAFYQYATIERRRMAIQLKIEGLGPKYIATFFNACDKITANISKQLLGLENSKTIPLKEESNTESKLITTVPKVSRKKKKKRESIISRTTSQFITVGDIPAANILSPVIPTGGSESTIISNKKTNPSRKGKKEKNRSSQNVPTPPLIKSSSDFPRNGSQFPFWDGSKNIIPTITHDENNHSPRVKSPSKN